MCIIEWFNNIFNNIIEWLNNNVGFMTILLYILLIAATIAYALWTKKIADATRKTLEYQDKIEREKIKPLVIISLENYSPGTKDTIQSKWVLVNIGLGPALNIRMEGFNDYLTDSGITPKFANARISEGLEMGNISLGSKTGNSVLLFPHISANDIDFIKPENFVGIIHYEDILGSKYTSTYSNGRLLLG